MNLLRKRIRRKLSGKTNNLLKLIVLVFVSVLSFQLLKGFFNFSQPMRFPSRESFSKYVFINQLAKSGIDTNSLDFKSDRIILETKEKISVVFPLKDNLDLEVASLQLIISRSKIEGKLPSKVDLRYNKPVVIY